jgi:hypothetical protein
MTSDCRPMTLQPDPIAYNALRAAQWTFGATDGTDVYELRLNLATPAAITAEKANAPAIGLPNLDGFLSYVAFRAALNEALQANPELSKGLIWQWNIALHNPAMWIDFPLPLRTIPLQKDLPSLFDCSVGLPVDKEGNILVPAGAFFIRNQKDFITYPDIVDSIPLRRRASEPLGRPIYLKRKLVTNEGTTKALDNRLYFPLTSSYTFFFRGDKVGVERLLDFALKEDIGLGKKTTLGYGRVASFKIVQRPDIVATWAYPILENSQLTLIKSLPYDRVLARREMPGRRNKELFGCEKFVLVAAIETLGTYRPPYWLREQRTQIVKYGSIIQKR